VAVPAGVVAEAEALADAEPGLVFLPEWRARANPAHMIPCYAGVGRKR